MQEKKYELIASNSQGAGISFHGDTMAECLRNFDAEYNRDGFMIVIHSDTGFVVVKRTFR